MNTPPVWTRNEIESPCVRLCVVHPDAGICTGCYRTMEEIRDWSSMAPETRREIMAGLPDRAGLLRKRRGGRAARMNRE